MSGGFFRGTSADQDTRFSNKQAKLMKSQKFAPELEHLVDVTKVKMDVIKPWIASRVTELLGFEDEVLINFIYGLVDGKVVNGKQIQIQITGFMEKNTGKFMKELWALLLSAQKNSSGVPQQFLDAKEEEIRQKKAETDRITQEIQKKKEVEQEKLKEMGDMVDVSRDVNDGSNPTLKHLLRRTSSSQLEEDTEFDGKNGSRGDNRPSRSQPAADCSNSSEPKTPRSISRSFSNSGSYSDDRHMSRSISRSPQSQGCLISPRRYRSPQKRSMFPSRKYSPCRPRSRGRSPHSRRRSSSRSWRISPSRRRRRSSSIAQRHIPSPRRRRSVSPSQRGSPSPVRRRSPSPVRRRSPSLARRRSPSPARRRSPSPARRRSPSPTRRRSPTLVRHRSPPTMQWRSPSPLCRRSSSPIRQRSPTHIRTKVPTSSRHRSPSRRWRSPSPPSHRSPSLVRRRSPPRRSPKEWRRSPLRSSRQSNRIHSQYSSRSPAYRSRRSLSRDHDIQSNGSKRYRDDYYASKRVLGKRSPVHRAPEREEVERSGQIHHELSPIPRQLPISLRSPQQDPKDRSDAHQKMPVLCPSAEKSPSRSESSPYTGETSPSGDGRAPSLVENPMRQMQERITRGHGARPVRQTRDWAHHHSLKNNIEEETNHTRGNGAKRIDSPRERTMHSPTIGGQRKISANDFHREEYLTEARGRLDGLELKKKDWDKKSDKASTRIGRLGSPTELASHTLEEVEYGPGRVEGERFSVDHAPYKQSSAKQLEIDSPSNVRTQKSYSRKDFRTDEKKHDVEDSGKTERVQKSVEKVVHNSDSEENEKKRSEHITKRKHKRSKRREVASDDDTSYDSQMDGRKEAKRRKKEEKRLRREERHKHREERHRRREERRSRKLKAKAMDTVGQPSDIDRNQKYANDSDGDVATRKDSQLSDTEEIESEQKRLEIELRNKALESLRAKKTNNP